MPESPLPSVQGRARLIIAAAAPLHALLALSTDLSPDEAYYLCAAREGGALPPLIDHPPLLPWLLRLVDRIAFLPLELRVRLVPIACSILLGLLCIELARRRGAGRVGCSFAAWIAGWAILPTTAGFVATPDGPALIAIAAGLLWAATEDPFASLGGSYAAPVEGRAPREGASARIIAGALATGVLLALGALAKVVVTPAAVLLAVLAHRRPVLARIAVLVPMLFIAPLLLPSLRFQLDHAFVQQHRAWSATGAVRALAEAILVQALLWSPWVLAWGGRAFRLLPLPDRGVLASISALISVSAVVRAAPPEANWWAPAAIVVLTGASITAGLRSSRARIAVIATVILPTMIASMHTLRPFLPLQPRSDPTARLHGWSDGDEPLDAAGVGPYGPAAERCVYRRECDEIASYFKRMNNTASGSF